MLSSVLRSARAVQVNIEVMRTFVRLRGTLESNADLKQKFEAPEERYDEQFRVVFEAVRRLVAPAASSARRRIGFASSRDSKQAEPGLKGAD